MWAACEGALGRDCERVHLCGSLCGVVGWLWGAGTTGLGRLAAVMSVTVYHSPKCTG